MLCYQIWGMRDQDSEEERDVLSSIYQLAGNSTSVLLVGSSGLGSGFIQLIADTWGEKSMGWIAGVEGTK